MPGRTHDTAPVPALTMSLAETIDAQNQIFDSNPEAVKNAFVSLSTEERFPASVVAAFVVSKRLARRDADGKFPEDLNGNVLDTNSNPLGGITQGIAMAVAELGEPLPPEKENFYDAVINKGGKGFKDLRPSEREDVRQELERITGKNHDKVHAKAYTKLQAIAADALSANDTLKAVIAGDTAVLSQPIQGEPRPVKTVYHGEFGPVRPSDYYVWLGAKWMMRGAGKERDRKERINSSHKKAIVGALIVGGSLAKVGYSVFAASKGMHTGGSGVSPHDLQSHLATHTSSTKGTGVFSAAPSPSESSAASSAHPSAAVSSHGAAPSSSNEPLPSGSNTRSGVEATPSATSTNSGANPSESTPSATGTSSSTDPTGKTSVQQSSGNTSGEPNHTQAIIDQGKTNNGAPDTGQQNTGDKASVPKTGTAQETIAEQAKGSKKEFVEQRYREVLAKHGIKSESVVFEAMQKDAAAAHKSGLLRVHHTSNPNVFWYEVKEVGHDGKPVVGHDGKPVWTSNTTQVMNVMADHQVDTSHVTTAANTVHHAGTTSTVDHTATKTGVAQKPEVVKPITKVELKSDITRIGTDQERYDQDPSYRQLSDSYNVYGYTAAALPKDPANYPMWEAVKTFNPLDMALDAAQKKGALRDAGVGKLAVSLDGGKHFIQPDNRAHAEQIAHYLNTLVNQTDEDDETDEILNALNIK